MSGLVCHYCPATGVPMTRDHIVPRSRGGANRSWNIVPACAPCNSAKGSRLPTCTCPKCVEAVRRWTEAKAERRAVRRFLREVRRVKAAGEQGITEVPDDLACLSPAMRDLLMRRRAAGS